MAWMIDQKINLTDAFQSAQMHRATTISSLIAAGLNHADAEAYTCFIFANAAHLSGQATECAPEDYLSEDQWDRLSLKG